MCPQRPSIRVIVQIDSGRSAAGAALTSGHVPSKEGGDRDTFDRPSAHSDDMPPAVDPSSVFEVLLGCEVLYETPHAHWVAAAIKLRLQRGGHAWIAGAVRDAKVRPHRSSSTAVRRHSIIATLGLVLLRKENRKPDIPSMHVCQTPRKCASGCLDVHS